MSERNRKPASGLFFTEPFRALSGLGPYFRYRSKLMALPKGDGHPVMVFPGFMASDLSTKPMRDIFRHLDYRVYTWGQGRNLAKESYEPLLNERLAQIFEKNSQRKVSLIGWSLGGIFAREIARAQPEKVRQVITLASPFNGVTEPNNASGMYRIIAGKSLDNLDPELVARMKRPLTIPNTNIFTKTDGIVPWQTCKEEVIEKNTENLEFEASHVGIGHSPCVLYCMIDRLAQAEGTWQPYLMGAEAEFFGGTVCGKAPEQKLLNEG
ncbi:MAG: alpha/beta hydrolase [Bacteroidota bacterium]